MGTGAALEVEAPAVMVVAAAKGVAEALAALLARHRLPVFAAAVADVGPDGPPAGTVAVVVDEDCDLPWTRCESTVIPWPRDASAGHVAATVRRLTTFHPRQCGPGSVPRRATSVVLLVAASDPRWRDAFGIACESMPEVDVAARLDPAGAGSPIRATEIDVVLTDVVPGDPSWDDIAARGSQRVIVLGDGSSEDHLLDALAGGAGGYVDLRGGLDDLYQAVRTVAAGGTHVPPWRLGDVLRRLLGERRAERAALERYARLSAREREVLALLADGADHLAVGERLFIAPDTARTHIGRILHKLEVHSREEAVMLATEHELLENDE